MGRRSWKSLQPVQRALIGATRGQHSIALLDELEAWRLDCG